VQISVGHRTREEGAYVQNEGQSRVAKSDGYHCPVAREIKVPEDKTSKLTVLSTAVRPPVSDMTDHWLLNPHRISLQRRYQMLSGCYVRRMRAWSFLLPQQPR